MEPREIATLATDYDRTLTDLRALEPVPEALDALRRARKAGKRVVVVSGRGVAHLEARLSGAADVLVGENGCLLRGADGALHNVGEPIARLRHALQKLEVEIEFGDVSASFDVAHEPLVREALERAGVRADLVRNVDRTMILPPGVDKSVGFLAALRMLGERPERAAAAGDGENDEPMLRAAGYAIAVANAVPRLKAIADCVTTEPGGVGLARWIEEVWLA